MKKNRWSFGVEVFLLLADLFVFVTAGYSGMLLLRKGYDIVSLEVLIPGVLVISSFLGLVFGCRHIVLAVRNKQDGRRK